MGASQVTFRQGGAAHGGPPVHQLVCPPTPGRGGLQPSSLRAQALTPAAVWGDGWGLTGGSWWERLRGRRSCAPLCSVGGQARAALPEGADPS